MKLRLTTLTAVIISALFLSPLSVANAQQIAIPNTDGSVQGSLEAFDPQPLPRPNPRETTGSPGPASSNFLEAFSYSLRAPAASPVGANDWACKPTKAHPRPVVLVHGTWEDAYNNWSGLAPELKGAGHCVFALNYGKSTLLNKGGVGELLASANGTGDIGESAKQLSAYVDEVLSATGAQQVDLVGHSQVGFVIRQYLKFEGGANPDNSALNKVENVVTLGATNHGTTLSGLASLAHKVDSVVDIKELIDYLVGIAGNQQQYDTPLINALNADGDTLPGLSYTVIATKYDQVATPYDSTFLTAGEGAKVSNILLQDGCEADHSDHVSMSYSPRTLDIIKRALNLKASAMLRLDASHPHQSMAPGQ